MKKNLSPLVRYVVNPSGRGVLRTYGVYRQPAANGTGQELVEGGFFSRGAAVEACNRWNATKAERGE